MDNGVEPPVVKVTALPVIKAYNKTKNSIFELALLNNSGSSLTPTNANAKGPP